MHNEPVRDIAWADNHGMYFAAGTLATEPDRTLVVVPWDMSRPYFVTKLSADQGFASDDTFLYGVGTDGSISRVPW